ncbi:MAG: hypothetical protein JW716_05750 [Candidatus Aenigmarchaeota archaeon]|nr:hypothetical protein [Candidatus Aenigmarchaeota archaeon]
MKFAYITLLTISLLFLANAATADVPVVVKITPKLERSLDYYNFSEEIVNSYQRFVVNLYNIGSIGCLTRVRFDIYNSTNEEVFDTVWSEEFPMEAGSYYTFETYWYPYNISGNFYSKMRIYQCNDIFEGPVSGFSVDNTVANETKKIDFLEEEILEVKKAANTESYIELEITAIEDLENLIFHTEDYPFGWIFGDKKIDKINKGEIKYLRINYDPEIWRETDISINIFDEENNYFSSKKIFLEKNNNPDTKDIIISVLGIIIFLLVFLKIKEIKGRRKKKK